MASDETNLNVIPMHVDDEASSAANPQLPMQVDDEVSYAAIPRQADGGPQSIPPLSISLDEVSVKLYKLQLELSLRTRDLANVLAKYDRAMIEGA